MRVTQLIKHDVATVKLVAQKNRRKDMDAQSQIYLAIKSGDRPLIENAFSPVLGKKSGYKPDSWYEMEDGIISHGHYQA